MKEIEMLEIEIDLMERILLMDIKNLDYGVIYEIKSQLEKQYNDEVYKENNPLSLADRLKRGTVLG